VPYPPRSANSAPSVSVTPRVAAWELFPSERALPVRRGEAFADMLRQTIVRPLAGDQWLSRLNFCQLLPK
jgi:hypothetical protein